MRPQVPPNTLDPAPPADAADALKRARRIVVKVGSSLVARSDGAPDLAWMADLAQDLSALRGRGADCMLVSSGAVALGRGRLGLDRSSRLDEKQAAASVGQSLLMQAWDQALSSVGFICGQVLLTREDTETRRRWLNARATVETLLRHGAVPVVNENDTVATEEIRYGDNDRLAARAAQLVRADLLVLLSDVDGLYTADPRKDPAARRIDRIESLNDEVLSMAAGPNAAAGLGTGGMTTKLQAAGIAGAAGCATVITLGKRGRPLSAIAGGAASTLIVAPASPSTAYKQWIAGSLHPRGALLVDAGAALALASGKSLLPSGVSGVRGAFDKGDCVRVEGPDGALLALGLVQYGATDVERLTGAKSSEIEARLGYKGRPELLHRDDLVLMTGVSERPDL